MKLLLILSLVSFFAVSCQEEDLSLREDHEETLDEEERLPKGEVAYFSCSNHDPQHLCKLGDDPKDCGKEDCVW